MRKLSIYVFNYIFIFNVYVEYLIYTNYDVLQLIILRTLLLYFIMYLFS